jgi:3',5'-cyclic AMP phosphodiesterase CpdA
MKKIGLLMLILLGGCCTKKAAEPFTATPEGAFTFLVGNDLGRNGGHDQKAVAAAMGEIAEPADIEFVATAGDVFHYLGVQSTADPLWWTNYEMIYSHPELQVDWYPVLGNHEYHGNSQAVIDYSLVSRRWNMPARYYTNIFENDGTTTRLVHIDTAPLIDKYRRDSLDYPDVCRQDMERELEWIDSVLLRAPRATWTVVIGHHPVWADTDKDEEERTDMQARLDPIMRRAGVDIYIAGHIHNFQHIRRPGSDIDYVVNTSGSLARKVAPIEGTRFCSSETGFSMVSATADSLMLYMLDKNAQLLHTVRRTK